jgi:hypothetical protein
MEGYKLHLSADCFNRMKEWLAHLKKDECTIGPYEPLIILVGRLDIERGSEE